MSQGLERISQDYIVAVARLLQEPAVTQGGCDGNCGCNEACGCKKDSCCENKCGCNQKTRITDPYSLVTNPAFADLVRQFDASMVRTVGDFTALVNRLNSDLAANSSRQKG